MIQPKELYIRYWGTFRTTCGRQGGDHDAEQHIAALELKAAETVSGNDRADNGEDDLGDNEAVGVDEGTPDADVAAVVLGDGVNVALLSVGFAVRKPMPAKISALDLKVAPTIQTSG